MTDTAPPQTYKNRDMATAPYPVRAIKRPVIVEGSYRTGWGYDRTVVGHHAVIVLSDGTEVMCCTAPNGHKKTETYVRCATVKVAELNDAAGIPEDVR